MKQEKEENIKKEDRGKPERKKQQQMKEISYGNRYEDKKAWNNMHKQKNERRL